MVLATGDAVVYSTLLFILFFVDMFVLVIIYLLKIDNDKDDDGNVIGINLQKYIKIVLIGLLYGLILITLNLMVAVAVELVDVEQFLGLIGAVFQVMLKLAWVWTLIIIIWIASVAFHDSKLVKSIQDMADQAERMQ